MQSKDSQDSDAIDSTSVMKEKPVKATVSSHIVTAESVQAEEVPTVPLGPLQTLSALQPKVSVHSVASTQAVSIPVPLVVQPGEYRRSLGEWLQVWRDGIRPAYLPLSVMPVLVGSTVAWTQTLSLKTPFGHFHLLHFMATLAAVILLQTGAHLVNDYYDYLKGIDTSNPLGPGGLIQQGLIKPVRVLFFGLWALILGALVGIVVAISGGPLVFLFGLLGLIVAYLYSGTSRALASMTLGELASFVIFGPLITLGAYMVQTGHPDRTALLYSLPLGLLATAFIHVNNMRDVEGDAQSGKRTLTSILDLPLSRALYILLLLGAYTIIVALGVPHNAPHLLLITLWTLPTLVVAITGILRTDAPAALHTVMRQTLKLETLFTILLIAAIIVSAFLPIMPQLPAIVLPI